MYLSLFYLFGYLILLLIMSVIILYCIYYSAIKLTVWALSVVITFLLIELLIESNLIFIHTYINYRKSLTKDLPPEAPKLVPNLAEDRPAEKPLSASQNENYLGMKKLFNQRIFQFNYQLKKQYELLQHKFSGLSNELYRQSIYLIALLLLIYGTRNSLGYYSTEHNKVFLTNPELNAMLLSAVHDDNDVWSYIENEFLRKIHEYKNGWIHGHVLKVLGVVRLRQLRITNNSLHHDQLSASNEDRKNYLPNWKMYTNFRYGRYYWRMLEPWKYRTGAETKTIPIHGTIKFYPSGGYVCQLGRNMNNSLKITKFLQANNWIDRQTRVIFVEYTFYGPDSNLFNVNTIVMEKTIYGNYIVTPYIQTSNLLLILEDLSFITIVLFIILIGLTLIFFVNLVRELLKNRQHFIYNLWNVVDLVIVITISIMIFIFLARNFYVHDLLRDIEHSRNNEFIGFYYAVLFDTILAYVGGILICISTLRLWKILNYFEIFYALTKTLQRCMKSIAALTGIMCVCLMGYGLAVFVVNGSESILFYNFTKVLTTLTALSFGFNEEMSWTNFLYGGTTMGIVLYFILLVEFNIFISNMFITVIIYHLTLVKQENNKNVYTLLEYSKEKYSKLIKFCCHGSETPKPSKQLNLINYPEPIENEIPTIRGSLNNAAINSQIDYASELCENVDWSSFDSVDQSTILDYCGLVYSGGKSSAPERKTKESCGLLYKSKRFNSKSQ